MNVFWAIVGRYSRRARDRRAEIFRTRLQPSGNDLILDLGSGSASYIARTVPFRDTVVIADISTEALQRAAARYGFKTLELDESGSIPVPDKYFDIVFCNSVIQYVTVDKDAVHTYRTRTAFERAALARQQRFADEIRRVAKRYFVQTPNRYFLVESNTLLPGLFVVLPRRAQLRLISLMNRLWRKQTPPDWNLLTAGQMAELFPDAEIVRERTFGMVKSIVAVKA
jgi:methyltransferase family protein